MVSLFLFIFWQSRMTCSCVSSASLQNLLLWFSWSFLRFILTFIMLTLALSIAWLSLLVSSFIYSGLLVLMLVVKLLRCFILFCFLLFPFLFPLPTSLWVLCLMVFFSVSFFSLGCHLCWWYCSIISIVFFIHLLSPVVLSFIRDLSGVFFLKSFGLHYSFHDYFMHHGYESWAPSQYKDRLIYVWWFSC